LDLLDHYRRLLDAADDCLDAGCDGTATNSVQRGSSHGTRSVRWHRPRPPNSRGAKTRWEHLCAGCGPPAWTFSTPTHHRSYSAASSDTRARTASSPGGVIVAGSCSQHDAVITARTGRRKLRFPDRRTDRAQPPGCSRPRVLDTPGCGRKQPGVTSTCPNSQSRECLYRDHLPRRDG
jgi:hypothetical protein